MCPEEYTRLQDIVFDLVQTLESKRTELYDYTRKVPMRKHLVQYRRTAIAVTRAMKDLEKEILRCMEEM